MSDIKREKTELPRVVLDTSPIKKAELFNSLIEREVEFIADRSGFVQLRKKAKLFSVGQKADRFYLLVEGAVRVYRPREDGGSDEIAQYAPGDAIGDFDFARKTSYEATAEASEDSLLIAFPGPGLCMEDFVLEEPYIVSRILLNAIVMMTSRIKNTQKILLENLSWVNELHRRAYEDPGTGLWKQSFLADEINRILDTPTTLIMLKPDRFKILVDSRGHAVGDEAMVHIAMILKDIARKAGRAWPLRFKSNETGLLLCKCDEVLAESFAEDVSRAVAAIPPAPAMGGGVPEFNFSGTVVWTVWPCDGKNWGELFEGCYAYLMECWKSGDGGKVRRYQTSESNVKGIEK